MFSHVDCWGMPQLKSGVVFFEHAGELRIIVLRRKNGGVKRNPDTTNNKHIKNQKTTTLTLEKRKNCAPATHAERPLLLGEANP